MQVRPHPLCCTPWDRPTCLERVWCLYEVHHTLLEPSTQLLPCFAPRQRNAMLRDKRAFKLFAKATPPPMGVTVDASVWKRWGLDITKFSEAVEGISVAAAGATVAADKETILEMLRKARGELSATDAAIQVAVSQALARSFVSMSGDQLQRRMMYEVRYPINSFFVVGFVVGIICIYGFITCQNENAELDQVTNCIPWGVVGASFFVPSIFLGPICFFKLIKNAVTGPIIQRMKGMVIFLRLVQSRLRSDEARHALESVEGLTRREAVRSTKSAAGRGRSLTLMTSESDACS